VLSLQSEHLKRKERAPKYNLGKNSGERRSLGRRVVLTRGKGHRKVEARVEAGGWKILVFDWFFAGDEFGYGGVV